MNGFFKDAAIALPKFNPTDKQTIKPGPAVVATASISFKLIPLSSNAFLLSNLFFLYEL